MIELTAKIVLQVAYPLIPWVGVAAAGFGFGEIVKMETKRRDTFMISARPGHDRRVLPAADASTSTATHSNGATKAAALRTCFSFFNCQKYPPSLLFLLMTLGPMVVLLAMLEHNIFPAPISRFLITFGRVPLFFFVMQWYVIKPWRSSSQRPVGISPASFICRASQWHPGVKFDLPMVYFWFVVVLVILYFPCRWFAGVKARHKDVWWLSYL